MSAPEASRPLDRLAAVDLGSNSFHMVVARIEDGHLHVLDRIREPVRLAMGVTRKGRVSKDVRTRALAALSRMGERLRHLPPDAVRAVGTNAFRSARQDADFLDEASRALGHEIEVVSGQEEARLIYLGVTRSTQPPGDNCLVIDIGGGSTEVILGTRDDIIAARSLPMGCVAYARRFFPDPEITAKQMRKARRSARLVVEPFAQWFRRRWEHALGSSGTIRAIGAYAAQHGWSDGAFDKQVLKRMRQDVIEAGSPEALLERGVSETRAPVFAAGLAALSGIFDVLDVRAITPVSGAMREGVLEDLAGRHQDADVRDASVAHLQKLHRVDRTHAARVRRTAHSLFEQVYASWTLPGPEGRRLLGWACDVHEVGLSVAHAGHRRHGHYLVRHSNLAGFSRSGQALLATLVRYQRGRIDPGAFADLPNPWSGSALRILVLLRLSITLHRSRRPDPLPAIVVRAVDDTLELTAPSGWMDAHPLTRAVLRRQKKQLRRVGTRLVFG